MSFQELNNLINNIFSIINTTNRVPSPQEIWHEYSSAIEPLLHSDDVLSEFVYLGNGIYSPKAIETARILQGLKQRFSAEENNNRSLVGRIRGTSCLRSSPIRDQEASLLNGIASEIARLSQHSYFSRFQVEGWLQIEQAINNRSGMMIVAPTGSGKTEVFLMPIVYFIARSIIEDSNNSKSFIFLYPRVALLKDQLKRIFRCVHRAEQSGIFNQQGSFLGVSQVNNEHKIVVGFQFSGILSEGRDTLNNPDIFENGRRFKVVDNCPICDEGILQYVERRNLGRRKVVRCNNQSCGAEFHLSLGKNDHASTHPHILVTTAESLDRLYLNPREEFSSYLSRISGIIFDEAHLYYSIYGVHIHNLVRRLEGMNVSERFAKIASSATVSEPGIFASRFFYGNDGCEVLVHSANDYDQTPLGIEVVYLIQSPEEISIGASPTLIQSVMALGHGVLRNEYEENEELVGVKERAILFADSLDMTGRLRDQINDAENNKRLWEFRTLADRIAFPNLTCTDIPATCEIYLQGECWRAAMHGSPCSQRAQGLRESGLYVNLVSSKQANDFREGDIVVATATLEVGVDDDRVKSTVHYLPPRTVFSFIQRRGRAGRAFGEVAYTLMVLDNSPSSNFYLFRRDRLINGDYQLPLNPQNEVIRSMHRMLEQERQRMQNFVRARGTQAGIWHWICELLLNNSLLCRFYRIQLEELRGTLANNSSNESRKLVLKNWLETEISRLGNHLSLSRLLREVQEEVPASIRATVQNTLSAIDNYVANGDSTEVRRLLGVLSSEIAQLIANELYSDEVDDEFIENLTSLNGQVSSVINSIGHLTPGRNIEVDQAFLGSLYDFFRKLCEGFFSESNRWVLNSGPDTLKVTLQALFYLQLGMTQDDINSSLVNVEYFVPNAYFQTVQPIVIAIQYSDPTRTPQLEQENITELSTTLIPYKPVYRYQSSPYLSTLSVEHRQEWINHNTSPIRVQVRLQVEGVQQGNYLIPKKVYSKSIRGDEFGQQIVTLCPNCYAMHSFNRSRCNCGTSVQRVKLYSEPRLERRYDALESRRISNHLTFLERMNGMTTIEGASVEARRVFYDESVRYYRYIKGNNNSYRFDAIYETPLRYGISTKGILWDLSSVIQSILQNENLSQALESITVGNGHKEFNENLILHTAAHILHRAIASISGVNEQELEYSFNISSQTVVVWERSEGGAGLSEIFVNTLRANPELVYQELLSSIICPVDLSERPDWDIQNYRTQLSQIWGLRPDDNMLSQVLQEAQAEYTINAFRQQEQEENRAQCHPPIGFDGCPACIHTTYCTERQQQPLYVSRMVGEAIMSQFLENLDRNEYEALMSQSLSNNFMPPFLLRQDPTADTFYVLSL